MPTTTQVDSANTPIVLDLSGLAPSSTLTTGANSDQVQNAQGYMDVLVTVLPIIGGASPVLNQTLGVWVAGQNVSFATNPIAGIDGSAGAAVLTYNSTVNSLRYAGGAIVTSATSGLPYFIQPFSIAQLFGGIMPKFWSLYVAHSQANALAAGQASLFSFNGITYLTN